MIEYLGCILDENMSGETMTWIVLKNVNGKKDIFIDKVFIYYILSEEYYATL